MAKKSSKRVIENVASSTGLPPPNSAQKIGNSSILHAAFAPSSFRLSLFASVIRSLESEQLRIHDTVSGVLRAEYRPQRTKITCLDWGYGGPHQDEAEVSRKKRRKLDQVNGVLLSGGDVIVALGTHRSEVELFSPAEAKVIGVLKDGHSRGVLNFKFVESGRRSRAWSLGGDQKLVEWDVWQRTIIRTVFAPSPSVKALLPLGDFLLVGDQSAYILKAEASDDSKAFLGSPGAINCFVAQQKDDSSPASFLASSEASRYISAFDVTTESIMGSLISERDVESLALSHGNDQNFGSDHQALAAITQGGIVEIFRAPFEWSSESQKSQSLKKNKNRTRKADATITLTVSGHKKLQTPIVGASFWGSELVLAVVEHSVHVSFERIQWADEKEGSLTLSGPIQLSKATSVDVNVSMTNGAKRMKHTRVDESRAQISHGGEAVGDEMAIDKPDVIDISSGVEESSESEPDVEAIANGVSGHSEDETEADQAEDSEEITAKRAKKEEDLEVLNEEPSFGDLIRAKEPIDVATSLPTPNHQALVPVGDQSMQPSTGLSFGTVLTQSLRTNDTHLLESCLHMQDLHAVRATIERLDAGLATSLLQRLAERLHSRPGRAGSLMVWVQWTLIAHGGHLAAQPGVVKQLASLHKVVQERARSLQPLLQLKGKLDMLEAQMNLRRSMMNRRGAQQLGTGKGVIYIEGQEETDSEDEGEEASGDDEMEDLVEEEIEDEEGDGEEADEDTGADEADSIADGFIDDEAVETDDESAGSLDDDVDSAISVHSSDDDDDHDADDENDISPPSKASKCVNGLYTKR